MGELGWKEMVVWETVRKMSSSPSRDRGTFHQSVAGRGHGCVFCSLASKEGRILLSLPKPGAPGPCLTQHGSLGRFIAGQQKIVSESILSIL